MGMRDTQKGLDRRWCMASQAPLGTRCRALCRLHWISDLGLLTEMKLKKKEKPLPLVLGRKLRS